MKKLIFILLLAFGFSAHAQRPPIIDLSSMQILISGPNIILSKSSLPAFSNVVGTPSTSNSFTYTGSLLTSNVTVTIPSGFEASNDGGSTWHTSFTITLSGGNIGGTMLVRIAASTAVGPYSGFVSFVSSPATTQTVAVSGTVNAATSLSASPLSITGLNGTAGTAGTPQTVKVTFSGTTITATAPAGTEISKDSGSTYTSPQTFSTVSPIDVKIRTAAAAAAGPISGNLVLAGSGVTTVNVSVAGTISSPGGAADSIRIDLGTSNLQSGWTQMIGDPHTAIVSVTGGNNNTITVTSVSTSTNNWFPVGSPLACAAAANGPTNGTVWNYATTVMRDNWFNYSGPGTTANFNASFPQFNVTGLNPAKTYSITFTGSIVAGFTAKTEYRSIGGNTVGPLVVDCRPSGVANTSAFIVLTGCQPDGTGKLNLYVNTQSGQQVAMVSGFIIKEE